MRDTIYREDAIKALYKYSFVSKNVIEREIRAIPTADRPQGEWIDTGKLYFGAKVYACSVCGEECDEMPTCMGKPMWKYCPYCSADMRGESDDR